MIPQSSLVHECQNLTNPPHHGQKWCNKRQQIPHPLGHKKVPKPLVTPINAPYLPGVGGVGGFNWQVHKHKKKERTHLIVLCCSHSRISISISTRKTNMFVFLVLMLMLLRLCLCASENSIRQISGFVLLMFLLMVTLMSRVFSLVMLMR